MKKAFKKIASLMVSASLIVTIAASSISSTSAAESTGVGLSAHALTAYNENWSYVYGGTSYGTVDCSGLIWTYNGVGGIRTDMLAASSEWGYVSNGIPRIHGLGLHQPGHVGVYIGGGAGIDARDENSGVVYHDATSKGWVEWFKVSGVSYPNNGWVLFNGDSFYYEDGQYVVDTTRTLDGVTYSFDSSGASDMAPPSSEYEATDYSESSVAPAPEPSYSDDDSDNEENNSDNDENYGNDEPASEEPSNEEPASEEPAGEEPTEEEPVKEEPAGEEPVEEEPKFETIEAGADGDDVTKIQDRLRELGYFNDESTGYFATGTQEAVKSFQDKAGLTSNGAVDEETWNLLFSEDAPEKYITYSLGDFDEMQQGIENIQNKLIALQYYYEDATGYFGEATESALKFFQEANDLEATGVADKETQMVLFGGEAKVNPNAGAVVYGMSGTPVTTMQERLIELRYMSGEASGYFGDDTLSAVNAYQTASGLELRKSLSPEQLDVLYSSKAVKSPDYDKLQKGYQGDDIEVLQNNLIKLGYYKNEINGIFDDSVEASVKKYQSDNGLNATGIVDNSTAQNIKTSIARLDSKNGQSVILTTAVISDKALANVAGAKSEQLSFINTQQQDNLSAVRTALFVVLGFVLALSAAFVLAMKKLAPVSAATAAKKPRYSSNNSTRTF